MKTFSPIWLLLIFCTSGLAQVPMAFQYQAVLRSTDGNPLVNSNIELKISILSDTVQNIIHFSELQNSTTDDFGRINLQIGTGELLSGNFSEIAWETGSYFIRIEFDESGGTNYQLAGQMQLLSVPYSLYSNHSGDSYSAGEGISITGTTITNTGDLNSSNELQTLSKSGNTIHLSQEGGTVIDSDNQTLTLTSIGTTRQVQLSNGNTINIDVADNDNVSTNELQVLSISNDTIFLSNGGFVKLPVPTNAIVPPGGCIQSLSPDPPAGYIYSGAGFMAGDQWNMLSPMTYSRFGSAVAALNNKIYVMGGWDGINAVSSVVEVYDINSQTWERKANMQTAVVYAAAAVVGTSIYVMGGYNGSSILNRHQVYNTLTNSWSLASNLPQARSGCGAAVVSDKIYLIGGYYNNVSVNTNLMYDPSTGAWTSKTSMPTARTDFAIACLNGGIYVIAGWDESPLNVNEFYNPATDAWTTYYPSITYRAGCSGAVANNKIYLTAGGDEYSYNSKTEEYDPLTNEWKMTASTPSPRSYCGAVSINNKIWVVGGSYGQAINSLLKYDPSTIQFYLHCSQ